MLLVFLNSTSSNNRIKTKNNTGSVHRTPYHHHFHFAFLLYTKFKVITLQTWTNCKIKHKNGFEPAFTRIHNTMHIISYIWEMAFCILAQPNFSGVRAQLYIFDWITIIGFVKWIVALLIWFTEKSVSEGVYDYMHDILVCFIIMQLPCTMIAMYLCSLRTHSLTCKSLCTMTKHI